LLDTHVSGFLQVKLLMSMESVVTLGDVHGSAKSSSEICFPFREIDFTSLSVDDIVELYHIMSLLFHCPHGDFLEGESFLHYFTPTNADSSSHLERLRSWLQRKSRCPVDFDSPILKEEILMMRKNLYKWTKIAKRCAVRRSARDSSRGTADFLSNIDEAPVKDYFLCTKELISLAMECRRKQRADGILPKDADDDTAVPTKARKRKRAKKMSPECSHYFDEDPSVLKPLLIFDLNKVLVWRRKKSMYFVIRPHAIEVPFDATR
jgi:hypothetical protein